MVLDALTVLTQLSLLLLVGLLGTLLARKLRISNVLILLLAGAIIGKLANAAGAGDLLQLEEVFLVSLAVVTLAVVVFEGTSRLSYRQLDTYSVPSLKITFWQVLLASVLVGVVSYALLFHSMMNGVILSLIFAVAIAGTDPSSVLLMVKDGGQRVIQLLTLESILNTPIMVLIPFILIDMLNQAFAPEHLLGIAQQLIVGVGTGVILGIIVAKALKKFYADNVNTVAVISATLLAYILAENLEGSGVLAVATFGVLFGNFTIKKKEQLQEFSFAFSNVLELLIFVLIGIIIGGKFPLEIAFILQTLTIFAALVVARAVALIVVIRKDYSGRELLFCTFTMPKGIAIAVLIFTFALVPQIPPVMLSAMFAITIYSIISATISGYLYSRASVPAPKTKHHAKKATAN